MSQVTVNVPRHFDDGDKPIDGGYHVVPEAVALRWVEAGKATLIVADAAPVVEVAPAAPVTQRVTFRRNDKAVSTPKPKKSAPPVAIETPTGETPEENQ